MYAIYLFSATPHLFTMPPLKFSKALPSLHCPLCLFIRADQFSLEKPIVTGISHLNFHPVPFIAPDVLSDFGVSLSVPTANASDYAISADCT